MNQIRQWRLTRTPAMRPEVAMPGQARMLAAPLSHGAGRGQRWGTSFCGQGRRKEEEEEEGDFPSGGRDTSDSDPPPRSREVESEEEEEESKKETDEAIEESPVPEDRLARRSESPAAKR
jgi:hypothetical protein